MRNDVLAAATGSGVTVASVTTLASSCGASIVAGTATNTVNVAAVIAIDITPIVARGKEVV